MKDRRRIALAAAVTGIGALAIAHPSADIRIVTHDVRDLAPHRLHAAFDFGLAGVSVLYTWTAGSIAR